MKHFLLYSKIAAAALSWLTVLLIMTCVTPSAKACEPLPLSPSPTPPLCQAAARSYIVELWVHEQRTAADEHLIGWFNDSLAWVKGETSFRMHDTSHPKYQEDQRQQFINSLPTIVIYHQHADGTQHFVRAWRGAGSLPNFSWQLDRELRDSVCLQAAGRFRDREQRGLFRRGDDDAPCPGGVCPVDPVPLKQQSLAEIEAERLRERERAAAEEAERERQAKLEAELAEYRQREAERLEAEEEAAKEAELEEKLLDKLGGKKADAPEPPGETTVSVAAKAEGFHPGLVVGSSVILAVFIGVIWLLAKG